MSRPGELSHRDITGPSDAEIIAALRAENARLRAAMEDASRRKCSGFSDGTPCSEAWGNWREDRWCPRCIAARAAAAALREQRDMARNALDVLSAEAKEAARLREAIVEWHDAGKAHEASLDGFMEGDLKADERLAETKPRYQQAIDALLRIAGEGK